MKSYNIAYLLTRLSIGMSFFVHGFIRLTKLSSFSQGMTNSFSKSMLPVQLVKPFSMTLPFFEFTVGLLLLIGLFTRQALVVGSIMMLTLIFGTGVLENWEAIPSQLIHSAFLCVLLAFIEYNTISVDALIKTKNK